MTAETTQKNNKSEDQEKPLSIGAFLKTEREKKGYTLDQMVSKTRLRQYLLEAIENENWDILPAPVFVKGFIRSYARVLALDEEDIVNQYDRVGELKEPLPQPLTKPIRSRSTPVILLILALAVIIAIIIFWRSFKTQNLIPEAPDHVPETRINEMSDSQGQPEEAMLPKPEIITKMASIRGSGAEEIKEKSQEISRKEDDLEKLQQTETAIEAKPKAVTINPEPEKIRFKLKAMILEETYVRIYIDDKGPKEYIFRPGSRPQWEAENGFYVLIGNAAGVEFEFEDKQYENLGRRGQIIRLNFPKEFNVHIPEE